MWSRLAAGQREAAVEPYLRCFELLRSRAARGLPGKRRLQVDAKTAMSAELVPVWFDAAAKAALPGVQHAIRGITQPRPEGAMSITPRWRSPPARGRIQPRPAVDSRRRASARPPGARSCSLSRKWPRAVPVQSKRCEPPSNVSRDVAVPRALYWLGLAGIQSADEGNGPRRHSRLLTLPAEYGRQQPELAAAGLYHAAAALDKLKDDRGAAAVRASWPASSGRPGTGQGRTRGEPKVIRASGRAAAAAPAAAW